jgi:hypothetical protein
VRQRDLGEADPPGDLADHRLMPRMAVAVERHHGYRSQAVVVRTPQVLCDGPFVERDENLAVCGQPFVRLDHRRVDELRQHDLASEDSRAVLIGDP